MIEADPRYSSSELMQILIKRKMKMEQADDARAWQAVQEQKNAGEKKKYGGSLYKIIDAFETGSIVKKNDEEEEEESTAEQDEEYDVPSEIIRPTTGRSHLYPMHNQTSVDSSSSVNSFLSALTNVDSSSSYTDSTSSSEYSYASSIASHEPKKEKPKILPKPKIVMDAQKSYLWTKGVKNKNVKFTKQVQSSSEESSNQSDLSSNATDYTYIVPTVKIEESHDNNNSIKSGMSLSMNNLNIYENDYESEENIYESVSYGAISRHPSNVGSINSNVSDEFGSVPSLASARLTPVSASNSQLIESQLGTITKTEKYAKELSERASELVETESYYVGKLRHTVSEYMPLLKRPDVPPELPGIFSNIKQLYRFHALTFLPSLRRAGQDLSAIAKIFLEYETEFDMYLEYSRNNKNANNLYITYKDFFKEKQLELGDRLDLSSYLLKPIQRVPQYQLFLDDLIKTFSKYEKETRVGRISCRNPVMQEKENINEKLEDKSEEDTTLKDLKAAATIIRGILKKLNDAVALENIRDCPLNLSEQGHLLRQDEFTVTDNAKKTQPMRVFLFERVLMFTSILRKQPAEEFFLFRDAIHTIDLGLTQPEHEPADHFGVWYRKRTLRPYTLQGGVNLQRIWVKDISTLLWKQINSDKERIETLHKAPKPIKIRPLPETPQEPIEAAEPSRSRESNPETEVLNRTTAGDQYTSLRGVPGEIRKLQRRLRTTWYVQ